MKGLIIFFNDKNSKYADKKVFSGQSAREISQKWAEKIGFDLCHLEANSLSQLLDLMVQKADEKKADFLIFSYDDLPFLDENLTKKMINSHIEYKAEYTFADGYPYGFTPEIIDAGTLKILASLSKSSQKDKGDLPLARDSIIKLIESDINSFEVEAELAPHDWRLYRFAFHCGRKENFMQTKALYDEILQKNQREKAPGCENERGSENDRGSENPQSIENLTADEKSKIASQTLGCLKTIPGFYNIQIADKVLSNYTYLPYKKAYQQKFNLSPENAPATAIMPYEKFSDLVDKIADFSEDAVISLSSWGEPLTHPDCLKMIEKVLSYKSLSVFLETDGLLVTDDFASKLKNIVQNAEPRTNGWGKVMIAVAIDSFTAQTYTKLHQGSSPEDFSKAVAAISKLQGAIPGSVYPQFVRINDNEAELEGFFRYWNEKTNPSGGNLIIQKYDDFAGLLPSCKPADLSPLEKNPCWHLRRDLTILSNGDVPSCRAHVLSGIIGNVFNENESLEKIWHKTDGILQEQINQQYKNKCERCDENYTYNF